MMRGRLSDPTSEECWTPENRAILFTVELLSAFNRLWEAVLLQDRVME